MLPNPGLAPPNTGMQGIVTPPRPNLRLPPHAPDPAATLRRAPAATP